MTVVKTPYPGDIRSTGAMVMRWSEMGAKEIVNVHDGGRIGLVGESDLLLDEVTGGIDAIAMPEHPGGWRARGPLVIPWAAIRKVGPDLLIVDLVGGSQGA